MKNWKGKSSIFLKSEVCTNFLSTWKFFEEDSHWQATHSLFKSYESLEYRNWQNRRLESNTLLAHLKRDIVRNHRGVKWKLKCVLLFCCIDLLSRDEPLSLSVASNFSCTQIYSRDCHYIVSHKQMVHTQSTLSLCGVPETCATFLTTSVDVQSTFHAVMLWRIMPARGMINLHWKIMHNLGGLLSSYLGSKNTEGQIVDGLSKTEVVT